MAWRVFVLYLNRNPLLAQATSTGLVCGMGDVIAQQIIERKATVAHDWRRTAKMAAIGFCFTGPVLSKWFNLLDKVLGKTVYGSDAFKKMAIDQVLFAPILFACLLPLFGISQGLRGVKLREKVHKVWPIVQMINFYFVPLIFRVNFVNLVSLGWNSYLASIANRPIEFINDNNNN